MSSRRERMVSDLDREIADTEARFAKVKAETEAHLAKLREARKAIASTVEGGKRTQAPQSARPVPNGNASVRESLEAALRRVMVDGATWTVKEATRTMGAEGRGCSRASVNAALNRGARRTDGPFEQAGHGQYRLRQGGPPAVTT